jgi:hypothetical protein
LIADSEYADVGCNSSSGRFDVKEVDCLDDRNGEGNEQEYHETGDWWREDIQRRKGSNVSQIHIKCMLKAQTGKGVSARMNDSRVKKNAGKAARASILMEIE